MHEQACVATVTFNRTGDGTDFGHHPADQHVLGGAVRRVNNIGSRQLIPGGTTLPVATTFDGYPVFNRNVQHMPGPGRSCRPDVGALFGVTLITAPLPHLGRICSEIQLAGILCGVFADLCRFHRHGQRLCSRRWFR